MIVADCRTCCAQNVTLTCRMRMLTLIGVLRSLASTSQHRSTLPTARSSRRRHTPAAAGASFAPAASALTAAACISCTTPLGLQGSQTAGAAAPAAAADQHGGALHMSAAGGTAAAQSCLPHLIAPNAAGNRRRLRWWPVCMASAGLDGKPTHGFSHPPHAGSTPGDATLLRRLPAQRQCQHPGLATQTDCSAASCHRSMTKVRRE